MFLRESFCFFSIFMCVLILFFSILNDWREILFFTLSWILLISKREFQARSRAKHIATIPTRNIIKLCDDFHVDYTTIVSGTTHLCFHHCYYLSFVFFAFNQNDFFKGGLCYYIFYSSLLNTHAFPYLGKLNSNIF